MGMKSNIIMHMPGGKAVGLKAIRDVVTPPPSGIKGRLTHRPVPHIQVVEKVLKGLDDAGFTVEHSGYGLGPGLLKVGDDKVKLKGGRMFGLLQLGYDGPHTEVADMLGFRNFHDKQGTIGFAVGDAPFVCDNLSFSAEIMLFRKHTMNVERNLASMIDEAVGKLATRRVNEDARITRYKETEVTDVLAHHLTIQAVDSDVVPVTRVKDVLSQWRTPEHDEFKERTLWSYKNAITNVMRGGNLFDKPKKGMALNQIMDTACGFTGK